MPELSIIVPIYNVEAYLPRCIDSILAQTFTDFEVILIDDGSPDNCGKIIDEYAKSDNRIVVIHQENAGVSSARNAGLNIAKGIYIGFVDPDDWIEPEMYEVMITRIKETGADIACCNWSNIYEDGRVEEHIVENVPSIMNQEEFAIQFFSVPRTIAGSVCNKLYKKDCIDNAFNTSCKICEDNLFNAYNITRITGACFINKFYYHIYQRSDSATRKIKGKEVLGLPVRNQMIKIMRRISHKAVLFAEKDYIVTALYLSRTIDRINEKEYYYQAKKSFKTFFIKNFFKLMTNRFIKSKSKIAYLYYFVVLH